MSTAICIYLSVLFGASCKFFSIKAMHEEEKPQWMLSAVLSAVSAGLCIYCIIPLL